MYENDAYPLDTYLELEPLCDKGHVLLVQNREDGQLYVKKRIHSYAPELYRLLREEPVEKTPRIYGIYPDPEALTGSGGGTALVIIEEYLPGHTLAEHLRDDGPFSVEEVIRIGLELCAVLKELHGRKPAIVHRDIKPENVMLLPDGSAALLDFSAAKLEATRERRDTVLIGTAGFAAPEQYGFSSSTPQTDIYSMGVLLNVLATGALPWERRAGGKLRFVIERCLKLDPKDRYADIRELRAALKHVQRERFPWLPPGFRSLCWYKMVPASMFYALVASFSRALDPQHTYHTLADQINYCLCGLLGWLLPVLFYGNYMGVRRFFPFMRSPNRWVRRIGMILSPIWLWFVICFAVFTINSIFQ